MTDAEYRLALDTPLSKKVKNGLAVLKAYAEGAANRDMFEHSYYGGFSGGKDSESAKALTAMAGVPVKWYYNVTTIDPPELVRHIKAKHQDVIWNRPHHAFFTEVKRQGLPTRRNRWCCRIYKERGGDGLFKIFGLRCAESSGRKSRVRLFQGWPDRGYAVNPLAYWTDENVWEFIRAEGLSYCELYDEGFHRLGCIGCPQARQGRRKQFARWPGYEREWRRASAIYHATHDNKTIRKYPDPDEFFEWWLSDNKSKPDEPDEECMLGLFSQ